MKKLTLTSGLLVAIVVSSLFSPLYAAGKAETLSTEIVQTINANPADTISIFSVGIEIICDNVSTCADPVAAEELVAAVITAVGVDSAEITNILSVAATAGVNVDDLTVLAIALGVDATTASKATASGFYKKKGNKNNNTNYKKKRRKRWFWWFWRYWRDHGHGGGGGGISHNC